MNKNASEVKKRQSRTLFGGCMHDPTLSLLPGKQAQQRMDKEGLRALFSVAHVGFFYFCLFFWQFVDWSIKSWSTRSKAG